MAAESLETRTVLTAVASFTAGTLTLTGNLTGTTNDAIIVKAGASYTDILVNGKFFRLNLATSNSISTINFDAGVTAGTDSLSISGVNQAITVGLTNNVEKLSLTSTRDAVVTADNALILGTSTVSGTLSVTTNPTNAGGNNTGNITQSGKLIVSGVTTIDANSVVATVMTDNGGDITLSTSGNSFGTLELSGTNITINEAGATDLGASTAVTSLTVTSRGAITDSSNVSAGTTTLTSVGNAITLDQTGSSYGALTLTGTDIAISDADAGTALASVKATGTLSVTAKGPITQTGSLRVGGLATFVANNTVFTNAYVNNAANDQDITLDETGGSNNFGSVSVTGKNVIIKEHSAVDLSSSAITGTLAVTACGAVTDSGSVVVAGATTVTAKGGAITLDEPGSTYGSTVTLTGTNVALTDNDGATILGAITATGNFTLALTGDTGTAANNKVTQVTASVANIAVGGTLSITNNGGGAITLTNDGTGTTGTNTFGSISITNTSSAAVSITEASASNLTTSTIGGALTLISGGNVTDSGDLSVTGATGITAPSGKSVTLDASGSEYAGTITFTGASSSSLKNVVLVNGVATDLGATKESGTLTVTSAGAVTDAGALEVTGKTTINANGSDITLNGTGTGSKFSSIAVDGADIVLKDQDAIDLASVAATGKLDVTTSGAITDSGTVSVGTTTKLTSTNNAITLDSAASTFTGTLLLVGGTGAVSVQDNDAAGVTFAATASGTSTASSLTINAAGPIDTTGATITVSGATTFNAGTEDITVVATATAGSFNLTGSDATLTRAGASTLTFGTVALTGTLTATPAAGAITIAQTASGTIVVGSSSGEIDVINAGTGNITLGNTGNSFGSLQLTGTSITIKEAAATDLFTTTAGASSATAGTLIVTSSGAITQSGVVTVHESAAAANNGSTTLTATGNAITLTNASNDFHGTITSTGSNVAITDNDATGTVLGATTATGTLAVIAAAPVTQSGTTTITAGGAATVTATGKNVTLTNTTNKFGSIGVDGAVVQITEKDSTVLATTTATGNFTLISGGAVTQSGVLTSATAASEVTVTANSGNSNLTLDQANALSNTTGGIALNGVNVTLTNAAAAGTNLGTTTKGVTAQGTLTVTSTGAVTQTAAIALSSAGLFTLTGSGAITLTAVSNNFGSISITDTSASAVAVTENSATNLAGATIGGNFTLVSRGAITDSGNVTVSGVADISAKDTAGTTFYDITLDQTGSTFGDGTFAKALALNGKNLYVVSAGALGLGVITANTAGNLTLIVDGNVLNDNGNATVGNRTGAVITVAGNVLIDAGTNSITIEQANEDGFVHIVGVTPLYVGTVTFIP